MLSNALIVAFIVPAKKNEIFFLCKFLCFLLRKAFSLWTH